MLAAILDPFDRALQQPRRHGHHDVLGIDHVLAAEGTADVGHDDPHPAFVDTEQLHQPVAQLVRSLDRGPDRHLVPDRAVARDNAAPLDRMGRAAVLLQGNGEDMVGRGEGGRTVAVVGANLGDDVVFRLEMHLGRAGRRRVAAIRGRLQWLVVDLHQSGRVLRNIARLRDHRRDRFADETGLVLRQHHRPGGVGKLRAALILRNPVRGQHGGQVGVAVDGVYAGQGQRLAGIDAADQGVGMGAAHEGHLQHARHVNVVEVLPLSGKQGPVLEPPDARADKRLGHDKPTACARIRWAASSAAATIPW